MKKSEDSSVIGKAAKALANAQREKVKLSKKEAAQGIYTLMLLHLGPIEIKMHCPLDYTNIKVTFTNCKSDQEFKSEKRFSDDIAKKTAKFIAKCLYKKNPDYGQVRGKLHLGNKFICFIRYPAKPK
jgi:hypothetical protein